MPVAFRSASAGGASSGTAALVNKPSGLQGGDLLVAMQSVGYGPGSGALLGASGWSQVGTFGGVSGPSGAGWGRMWTRVADGGEPDQYTFSLGSSGYHLIVMGAFSGAAGLTVSDPTNGTASPAVCPSQTSVAAGAMQACFVLAGTDNPNTFTPAAGMTEGIEATAPGGFIHGCLDYEALPAAATVTGTRSIAYSNANNFFGSLRFSVLIEPAAGGGSAAIPHTPQPYTARRRAANF